MRRVINVVDHDPTWSAAFEQEAVALAGVFGRRLLRIHHIGSTSISGLCAKPIIDILIVLDQTGTINSFNAAMEALGYRPRGECLDATVPGTPGRFYFSKDRDGTRTHQVHVCADGHPEIADKLAFRDYVRAHPVEAAAYGELKQRLALAHSDDNIGYMLGKDAFVKSLLAAARLWYASSEALWSESHRSGSGSLDRDA
jgi:GrpB-like predicted nucleotidyltransferase (UPF0157 family)